SLIFLYQPLTLYTYPYTTLFRSTSESVFTTPDKSGFDRIEAFTFFLIESFSVLRSAVGKKRVGMVIPITLHPLAINALYMVVRLDRKSTRLNSSHVKISYSVFCF